MKAAIYKTRLLLCSAVFVHAALASAQPPRPPPSEPAMAAGWRGPPPDAPVGASAPRGNLRGDIENNARRNGNTASPHAPPPR